MYSAQPKVGEVWLVKIPQTDDHRIYGIRPAIVVSHSEKNTRSPLITVIPLSRNDNKPGKFNKSKSHMLISARNYTWLSFDSIALCEQETTCDKKRLVSFLGVLADYDLDEISLIKARSQPTLFLRAIRQNAQQDDGFMRSLFEENRVNSICLAG